jgi:hypothetical protein
MEYWNDGVLEYWSDGLDEEKIKRIAISILIFRRKMRWQKH